MGMTKWLTENRIEYQTHTTKLGVPTYTWLANTYLPKASARDKRDKT